MKQTQINLKTGDVTVQDDPNWTPPPITAADVKREAMRRILAIAPEWKQRNLTAQAAILADKGRDNWTADELAAWQAGEVIWGQISAIRAASDVIEAMDPIPDDYRDDKHWPMEPQDDM